MSTVRLRPTAAAGEELWQKCAKWLSQWAGNDETFAIKTCGKIDDFVQLLRDGVVLCRLANAIEPDCIDKHRIDLQAQMSEFFCKRNIDLFLTACQTKFAMPPTDMFNVEDLYDVENFASVLQTLSKLSTCPKVARLSRISGFSTDSRSSEELRTDSIYEHVRDEVSSKELRSQAGADDQRTYYNAGEEDEYLIYHSTYENLIASNRLISDERLAGFEPTNKREYSIKELYDTEITYIKELCNIVDIYSPALKQQLSSADHASIFMNAHELLNLHQQFSADLRHPIYRSLGLEKIATADTIGDIFVKYKKQFAIYSHYSSGLMNARRTIKRVQTENSQAKKIINKCKLDANQTSFLFEDIIGVPVTRVQKYHVILDAIINESKIKCKEDIDSLTKGKQAILDVNMYMNTVQGDYEMQMKIGDIVRTIVIKPEKPPLLASNLSVYGRLLKDGKISIKIADCDSKLKTRHVFLFERLIVICKIEKKKHIHINTFVLDEFRLVSTENTGNNTASTTTVYSRRNPTKWSLECEKNSKRAIHFEEKSMEKRIAWIRKFVDAFDTVRPSSIPRSSHKLRVHTYETAVNCHYCSLLLAGLVHQGYRCQACECNLHKHCIGKSVADRCPGKPLPPATPTPLPPKQLTDYEWYKPKLSREDADRLLIAKSNGAFVVRPSREKRLSALSLCYNKSVKHVQIESGTNECNFCASTQKFRDIPTLIEYFHRNSLVSVFKEIDTRLTDIPTVAVAPSMGAGARL